MFERLAKQIENMQEHNDRRIMDIKIGFLLYKEEVMDLIRKFIR